MNRDQKAAVVDEVAEQFQAAEAIFAVDYRGLSVPEAADLRAGLAGADATFRVVKNTLTERAVDKAGAGELKPLLEGPTAFTFVRGDVAVAAKALSDAGRAKGTLRFKGGWMNGAVLTGEQIVSLSRLPSRDALNAQLVGVVASPLTGLMRGLGGMIGGLARQLGQIAEQGLVGGDAPAPAAAAASDAPEPAETDQAPAADAAQAAE